MRCLRFQCSDSLAAESACLRNYENHVFGLMIGEAASLFLHKNDGQDRMYSVRMFAAVERLWPKANGNCFIRALFPRPIMGAASVAFLGKMYEIRRSVYLR